VKRSTTTTTTTTVTVENGKTVRTVTTTTGDELDDDAKAALDELNAEIETMSKNVGDQFRKIGDVLDRVFKKKGA
jgi:hypothetical protein